MPIYDAVGLHHGTKTTMRTYSGAHVDPFTMTVDDVVPADIVHSLANQCRFNGHSVSHLSVARHSIHVAEWLRLHDADRDTILAGLLHDAAEAYIGDLIRPLKMRPEFAFFRELDDRVTAIVFKRFCLPFAVLPDIVHEADIAIGMAEVNYLRHTNNGWTNERDEQDFRTALSQHRFKDFA